MNSSFKSGHGEKKWLDLFAHLSSVFSLKEGTAVLKEHESLTKKQLLDKLKKMIPQVSIELTFLSDLCRLNSL